MVEVMEDQQELKLLQYAWGEILTLIQLIQKFGTAQVGQKLITEIVQTHMEMVELVHQQMVYVLLVILQEHQMNIGTELLGQK